VSDLVIYDSRNFKIGQIWYSDKDERGNVRIRLVTAVEDFVMRCLDEWYSTAPKMVVTAVDSERGIVTLQSAI